MLSLLFKLSLQDSQHRIGIHVHKHLYINSALHPHKDHNIICFKIYMAKVHPCKPSSSSCSTLGDCRKTYTIWMKSLVANGNGFTVYDSWGEVVYRIDNYSTKCCREVFLMDLHGNVLFSMFQKVIFTQNHKRACQV